MKKTKQNTCPKCFCPFEYGVGSVHDEGFYYEVECTNDDCDFVGTEWYKLVFDNVADERGNPL